MDVLSGAVTILLKHVVLFNTCCKIVYYSVRSVASKLDTIPYETENIKA